jgi:hypothetical protein
MPATMHRTDVRRSLRACQYCLADLGVLGDDKRCPACEKRSPASRSETAKRETL